MSSAVQERGDFAVAAEPGASFATSKVATTELSRIRSHPCGRNMGTSSSR